MTTTMCSFYTSYAGRYAGYRRRGPLRRIWLTTTSWCNHWEPREATLIRWDRVEIGILTQKTANSLTNMYETRFYESSAIYYHSRLSPSHFPVTFAHLDSGSSRPDVKRQRQAQWPDLEDALSEWRQRMEQKKATIIKYILKEMAGSHAMGETALICRSGNA